MGKRQMLALILALLLIGTFTVVSCGGGGGGGGAAEPNVAFVTSVTGSGNLSTWAEAGGQVGLAAADAVCQARADAAGLDGTFAAWLSDGSDDAYCRMLGLDENISITCGQLSLPTEAGPWVRIDGFPFAGTLDQLVSGVVYAPVMFDEFGSKVPSGLYYYTGTEEDGTSSGTSCSDWTSSATATATKGTAQATGAWWTTGGSTSCAGPRPLLCMETGTGGPLPAFTSTGKRVFMTSVIGKGDLGAWTEAGAFTGLDAGDAICRNLADAAGYADTTNYVAWLSDSIAHAGSAISSGGPWVRPDGVKVAEDLSDLLDGELLAPINVTETLQYDLYNRVWTGTATDGSADVATCGNWTVDHNGSNGTRGAAVMVDGDWTDETSSFCDGDFALYCFEN